jgi:hypothetical protein
MSRFKTRPQYLHDPNISTRDACLEAALQAYEDAGMQGLCAEGRWEAAVGALKAVELAPLLRELKRTSAD